MYNKETTFKIIDTKVYDDELLKTAALGNLPEEYDPDFLYVRVRAISAGEYWGSNKNADFFAEKELRDSYHTFLEAHVFKNHENKDVAKAIGSIIEATWNDEMKYVELLIKIDKQLAPTVVRGFQKGYTTDVSMGCRVRHTVCSICGNVAKTRAEFCTHVRTMRNQILPDGRKVFEYNIGPRFHDLSVVLNGADRTAKALEIVASEKEQELEKAASTKNFIDISSYMEKCANEVKQVPKSTENITILNNSSSEINKLADIQKEIVDKLYVLAIIDKLQKRGLSNEEIETIIQDAKEAGVPLHLELNKVASTSKHIKNVGLGTLGIAAATNYYQGKRLRGEELNPVQDFIADNPGVLPIAFLAFGYPGYVKFKNRLKNVVNKDLAKTAAENYALLFSKEANENLNISVSNTINVFKDASVAEMFKKSYHVSDDKVNMIKLALLLQQGGREDLVDTIKNKYGVTTEDMNNYLKFSFEVVKDHIEKEANYLRGVIEANIFSNHKIPTGMAAPALAGSLLDGFLIHKFFYGDRPGEVVGKKVKENTSINVNI